MKQFFYAVGDERRGPISETSLLELFRLRGVSGPTLVWSEGMADWRPLAEVFPHWLAEPAPVPGAAAPESDNALCVISGRLLPKAGMIRFGDVYVSPESRDIYLQRLQQGLPERGEEFTPATIWQRFAGSFIDGLVLSVPLIALIVGLAALAPDATEDQGEGMAAIMGLLTIGVLLLGSACYEIGMTATRGATLGKMAMRTCVIDGQGQKPGWGSATGRWALKTLVSYVPWIGSIYSLVSIIMALADQPWRRAIHDRGAGTRVVQRRR